MSVGLFLIIVIGWAVIAVVYEIWVWRIHRMDLTISRLSRRYWYFRALWVLAILIFALWLYLHTSPSCDTTLHFWVHCA